VELARRHVYLKTITETLMQAFGAEAPTWRRRSGGVAPCSTRKTCLPPHHRFTAKDVTQNRRRYGLSCSHQRYRCCSRKEYALRFNRSMPVLYII